MKWVYSLMLVSLAGCTNDQKPAQTTTTDTNRNNPIPIRKGASNPYAPVDISPMDIIYFPADYPLSKSSNPDTAPPKARVLYSRPQKQGREIFGSLVKFGDPWRLGANEATEIELFSSAMVQGKRLNAGRYILYCIPEAKRWTFVFNSNVYSWGLHPYPSKDVLRVTVPVQKTPVVIEHFTMAFEKTAAGADLLLAWDDTEARVPFQF